MNEGPSTGPRVFVDRLVEVMSSVRSSLDQATAALLDVDLEQAELVIDGYPRVEALLRTLDDCAVTCQPPLPADIGSVATGVGIDVDLQRMEKLAWHIATTARTRYPRPTVPNELRPTIRRMSQAARRVITQTRQAIAATDADTATRVAHTADEIFRLHHRLLRRLFDQPWRHGVDTAVDIALIGHYYERFASHALTLASRVAFLTGSAHLDGPATAHATTPNPTPAPAPAKPATTLVRT
jgi:phosphate transport system protein